MSHKLREYATRRETWESDPREIDSYSHTVQQKPHVITIIARHKPRAISNISPLIIFNCAINISTRKNIITSKDVSICSSYNKEYTQGLK